MSDACETGMGGYDSTGMAWCYELPVELIGKFTINILEFLASAITIHLSMARSPGPDKILAFTDSSSALGWLYKASFSEIIVVHDELARWIAMDLLENDAPLYSQHIKGKQNFIADCLSHDHHLSIE